MSEEEKRVEALRRVKQHLEIIDKHTDNYTNGALTATSLDGQVKVAGLVVEIARTETREALTELHELGV